MKKYVYGGLFGGAVLVFGFCYLVYCGPAPVVGSNPEPMAPTMAAASASGSAPVVPTSAAVAIPSSAPVDNVLIPSVPVQPAQNVPMVTSETLSSAVPVAPIPVASVSMVETPAPMSQPALPPIYVTPPAVVAPGQSSPSTLTPTVSCEAWLPGSPFTIAITIHSLPPKEMIVSLAGVGSVGDLLNKIRQMENPDPSKKLQLWLNNNTPLNDETACLRGGSIPLDPLKPHLDLYLTSF